MFPVEPLANPNLLSNISSFVDNSRYFYVSGSMALQDAFNCMSKFTGALLLWFASGSSSSMNHSLPGDHVGPNTGRCRSYTQVNRFTGHNLTGFSRSFRLKGESSIPLLFEKILSFSVRKLHKHAEQFQTFPMISLAAALIPPFNNESQNVVCVPHESEDLLMQRCVEQGPCNFEHRGCDICLSTLNYTRHAVEPVTGIEFPAILENGSDGETNSNWLSEVLVGTGSRTMKIIKIKSLKLYAFGFYIHPFDVCEKLGRKYCSIPASELCKHRSFYQDLLREDISMTIRLVVSANGIKISTVRSAFEKSLRARLIKTNPDSDFDCVRQFGSLFAKDIPIRAGTTIFFKRTADGYLITEIEGDEIGAVQSKDLCRAFFDMYIGDVPVCKQTKEEIGRNVASMIRRC